MFGRLCSCERRWDGAEQTFWDARSTLVVVRAFFVVQHESRGDREKRARMVLLMGLLLVVVLVVTAVLYRALAGRWVLWPLEPGRLVLAGAGAALVVGLGIQAVPYGRAHSNPPVRGEPEWGSARTEELVRRACFDCHSNETVWPWYSNVAPMSWVLTLHVDDGRDELNFSEWGDRQRDRAAEAAETVRDGEMPPWDYALAHPEVRLSASEQRELVDGLVATFGDEKKREDREDQRDEPERR